jgi:hypothetical protein
MYLEIAKRDNRLAVVNCFNKDGGMLFPEEIFEKIINIIRLAKLL